MSFNVDHLKTYAFPTGKESQRKQKKAFGGGMNSVLEIEIGLPILNRDFYPIFRRSRGKT